MVRKTVHFHTYFGGVVNVKFTVHSTYMTVYVYTEFGDDILLQNYRFPRAVCPAEGLTIMREMFWGMCATVRDDISKQREENIRNLAERHIDQVLKERQLIR
jgi:hypothetical protein